MKLDCLLKSKCKKFQNRKFAKDKDCVHGKRTNYPIYYKSVVEPIVSKELWGNCQLWKKKKAKTIIELKPVSSCKS